MPSGCLDGSDWGGATLREEMENLRLTTPFPTGVGLPRDVERVLERRGKPCFFDFGQGQKGQKASPARTKARTKMWETVAGLVVEAGMNVKMPEGVAFVGNWERESEPVEARVVELN